MLFYVKYGKIKFGKVFAFVEHQLINIKEVNKMELNFKIGAIIRFELMGCVTPVVKLGKVISVTSSFVTILPQVHIHRKDGEVVKDWTVLLNPESAEFDKNCTADSNIPVHIRRNLIMSWQYINVNI